MPSVSAAISLQKIKDIVSNPPIFIQKAQEFVEISANPLLCGFQSLVFDINDASLTTLYTFAVRQYSYMESIIDIVDKRFTGEKYKVVSFIWPIGTLASAMLENLLQFAFIADDFDNRAKIFYNFSTVQDLEHYPTKQIIDGVSVDEVILKKMHEIYKVYKKKNATFISDADYTNRNNYVADWYGNFVPRGNIKNMASAIKLKIMNGNEALDWKRLYQDYYHYLCDFKHVNWQKHCMSTDINCAKDMATQIINTVMFLFMKLNKIIVYICEEKYKPVDRTKEFKLSIDTLKNQIQEYENLFK